MKLTDNLSPCYRVIGEPESVSSSLRQIHIGEKCKLIADCEIQRKTESRHMLVRNDRMKPVFKL